MYILCIVFPHLRCGVVILNSTLLLARSTPRDSMECPTSETTCPRNSLKCPTKDYWECPTPASPWSAQPRVCLECPTQKLLERPTSERLGVPNPRVSWSAQGRVSSSAQPQRLPCGLPWSPIMSTIGANWCHALRGLWSPTVSDHELGGWHALGPVVVGGCHAFGTCGLPRSPIMSISHGLRS